MRKQSSGFAKFSGSNRVLRVSSGDFKPWQGPFSIEIRDHKEKNKETGVWENKGPHATFCYISPKDIEANEVEPFTTDDAALAAKILIETAAIYEVPVNPYSIKGEGKLARVGKNWIGYSVPYVEFYNATVVTPAPAKKAKPERIIIGKGKA